MIFTRFVPEVSLQNTGILQQQDLQPSLGWTRVEMIISLADSRVERGRLALFKHTTKRVQTQSGIDPVYLDRATKC